MARSRPINLICVSLVILGAFAFAGHPTQPVSVQPAVSAPQVDCLTPEGRLLVVPRSGKSNPSEAGVILNHNTLSCPLQEGETTFIIAFPKTSPLDQFTFLNQNAAAKGEMKIAVSNSRLPFDSPKWIEVSGKTAFTHKRRFTLSMVGVEARYLKISFRVEKRNDVAMTECASPDSANRLDRIAAM